MSIFPLILRDIENNVLNYLSFKDISKLSKVNKYYHTIARQKLFDYYYFFNYYVKKCIQEANRKKYEIKPSVYMCAVKYRNPYIFKYYVDKYNNSAQTYRFIQKSPEIIEYLILTKEININYYDFLLSKISNHSKYIRISLKNKVIPSNNKNLLEIILKKSFACYDFRNAIFIINKLLEMNGSITDIFETAIKSSNLDAVKFIYESFKEKINIKNPKYIGILQNMIGEFNNEHYRRICAIIEWIESTINIHL